MDRIVAALLVSLISHLGPGPVPVEAAPPQPEGQLQQARPEAGSGDPLQLSGALALARFPDRVAELRLSPPEGPPLPHSPAVRSGTLPTPDAGGHPQLAGVFRSAIVDAESRVGLWLPAPAQIAWDLSLPAGAVLTLKATVLPAADATDRISDGADLVVELQQEGAATELYRGRLEVGAWTPLRVPLAGRRNGPVRLRLRSEDRRSVDGTGRSPTLLDTVFVADPVVFVPKKSPRRVLLLFVDTLRPDHLGLFGYDRNTSPNLDRWSRQAVVFRNARATAPWTLPSIRSLLTGHQPDAWSEVPNLAEVLGRLGWHTAAVVDNPHLSDSFGMERGWSQHIARKKRPVDEILADGEAVMAANSGRDTLLLLHFMEPHLPYDEPEPYRHLWAGNSPSFLPDGFTRSDVVGGRMTGSRQRDLSRYVEDRYDQSIRYLDHRLAPVLRGSREDDIVVLFSDHGEEFWEHGGFEHGHALWDEVLRVVLMIKAPHLEPKLITAPVSLQDLTPTLLALLDVPDGEPAGVSLLPLMRGREEAAAELEKRPQAFSSPLYGRDAWGSLVGSRKIILRDGNQWLFDLRTDPSESHDISLTVPMEDARRIYEGMERAHGRSLRWCWRFTTDGQRQGVPLEVEIQRPGGFAEIWRAYDPKGRWKARPTLENGVVRIVKPQGELAPLEFFATSADGSLDPAGIEVVIHRNGKTWTQEVPEASRWREGGVVLRAGNRKFAVSLDIVKRPERGMVEDVERLVDPEVEERLKALGYTQ